jgi:3-phosphoshikimate 1-carboxyvinyltransferase
MPLPDLIEIVPPIRPVPVSAITIPGSKSITNRALILAALASGPVTLNGALWSEDTQVMTECLRGMGYPVEVRPDPAESANRIIRVEGAGGRIPRSGSAESPLELFVGNAGTAARFLAAMVCLGDGVFRLSGVPRMHERPQAGLLAALRELGYRVDSANDRLPATIFGAGPRLARCGVSVVESSQFASALLLPARLAGWDVAVTGANVDELPYVEMTRRLAEAFPHAGGAFQIEPDASSGSYFWGASQLLGRDRITVNHWPDSGWQIDARYPDFLDLPDEVSRERDLGDSIMTAITLAPLSGRVVRFTDLGRLRVQECERVAALRTELTKCGARITESGDTLTVEPTPLHGAEIETYDDHRMAMCFATLGLKVPGVTLRNPRCVRKTFPNFFQKLASPSPGGLGVTVRDPRSGRPIPLHELAAE